jgi:TRAP-type C4-dicarboxylate transport system substrate-binding protein
MRHFLLGLFCATVVLASPAAMAQTRWDMPSPASADSLQGKVLRAFAEDVQSRSNGSIRLTLHPDQSLLRQTDTVDALKRNVVPLASVNAQILATLTPAATLHSWPLLAQGFDQAFRLYQAQKPVLEQKLAEQNLVLLFASPRTTYGIFSPRALNSINDLREQVIVSQASEAKSLAERLNADFQSSRPSEVPEGKTIVTLASAQQGLDMDLQSQGATHFYDLKLWVPQHLVVIRRASLDGLGDDDRRALREAAAEAERRGWDMARQADEQAVKALREKNVVVEPASGALGGELETLGQTIAAERRQEVQSFGLTWPMQEQPKDSQ